MTTQKNPVDLTLVNHSGDPTVPDQTQFALWLQHTVENRWPSAEIDILLVDAERMAEVNLSSRNKAGPTNTLAFPFLFDDTSTPLFGEIIMCPQVIQQQAHDQQKPMDHHWAHLVVHSCLHLMGYDHEQSDDAAIMEAREIEILQQFAIPNPYIIGDPHE